MYGIAGLFSKTGENDAFAIDAIRRMIDRMRLRVSSFASGAGKRVLAGSPKRPLPDLVVNRPKTGFSLPMSAWLSGSMPAHAKSHAAVPIMPGMAWGRRWARTVLANITECA